MPNNFTAQVFNPATGTWGSYQPPSTTAPAPTTTPTASPTRSLATPTPTTTPTLGAPNQNVPAGPGTPGYTYVNGVLTSVGGKATGYTPPPAAPPITPISNPVTPPTTNGTQFTSPTATAPSTVSDYTTGVASALQQQTAQLQASYQQQTQNYQTQIDALNKQASDAKQTADLGLSMEGSAANSEAQDKAAVLQQEQSEYQSNYNAIQGLAAQATSLVTQSQALTSQLQSTTGLASIMNPRISQNAANVTAQLAVIKGAVDIYSGAIGAAQNQLKSATDAITSIYGDQLSYYQHVVSFYSGQQKDALTAAAGLSKDQQTYIDGQIKILSDQVANTQQSADYISKAMVDPTTALSFAKAGVQLTDTIPQINAKLATYQASVQKAWGAPYKQGADYVQKNTITGEVKSINSVNGTGANSGVYSFTPTVKTQLAGAGETSSTITQLEKDIGQYGAQYVLDHGNFSSDATKQVIETEFGITPTAAPSTKQGLFGLGFLGL